MSERYFHVSYSFLKKNKESGLGFICLNIVGNKITRQTIQDWKKVIMRENENCENAVILFYSELEDDPPATEESI